ncbi:MAG: hypothetical protein U1C74_26155, partial [Phenylobacterium sp.]|nr:hypothetical protein [Phenylobacterium sp.]
RLGAALLLDVRGRGSRQGLRGRLDRLAAADTTATPAAAADTQLNPAAPPPATPEPTAPAAATPTAPQAPAAK